jgi:hypothetical protein
MTMRMNEGFLGLLVLPGLLVALACAAGTPATDDTAPAPSTMVAGPVADPHPRVDARTGCPECHIQSDPEIVQEWAQSLHGQQDVGCYVCHGAIGVDFQARPGDESCAACHSAVMGSLAHPPADRCFSCHDAHRLAYP